MQDKNQESGMNEQTQQPENVDTNSTTNDTAAVNAQEETVIALQKEVEELKDKYLRQAAEFDNFRRRTAKERIELIQTASKDLVTELLEVLDDYERAEKQMENSTDVEALKEGSKLIFAKLRNILSAKGLKPMEAEGEDFNPDLHEAITEIPAPTEALQGKVIDQVVKGYYLNDKIIRYAKVVVGK
ncbi:nucleotide exchange factor GrpE [Gynurincola endophyticus]|uniref:nucleotide exchange factor GrpE n=1 Tax=Gynurincola endophyticus TaxID=2479004 RepID=UPI001F20AED9|nr:nucleotide exchange factor GrpE [Gynurincola endophyticus]